ncbi:MAG: branched-chain amino acid ABC transporter permease [Alphaproteobacteria bacterium]|nr:branched-chain amino acid ABC transporter permease [Alphaproteobacteria bacterium]
MSLFQTRWSGPLMVLVIAALLLTLIPAFAPAYVALQLTLYFSFGILGLSLAWVWGYGGIFSFGQAAFFGLGGYSYAVASINLSGSTVAILIGLAVPTAFAVLLGYFMFYGRLSGVYLAVITLVVTLAIHKFLGHTAGFEYRIGTAHLGGYNGMPALPPINVPGDVSKFLWPEDMYYATGIMLLAVYFGLRWLLTTAFGRRVIAVRENELRAELLGYDTRLYKLATFALGAFIAGLGGILFANWNSFIDPHVFELGFGAQIIIWVVVGGLGTLIGPILGAMLLGFAAVELGTQQTIDPNVILGAILLVFVLIVPQGVVPSVRTVMAWWKQVRANKRALAAAQVR